MYRLPAVSEAIRELTPPIVDALFALLTNLGDPSFLLVLVAVLYWLSDNRRGAATLVAYALLAMAVTITLKYGLGLPRPPAAARVIEADAGSFGFPSGHAIGATVVYGGLLLVDDRFQTPPVMVSIAGLIALVGFSRVVIGVHYIGDVLVGHAVGLVILGSLWLSGSGRRARVGVSALAALCAVVGAFVTTDPDALFALGGSLAAVAVFAATDPDDLPTPTAAEAVVLVGAGLGLVGGAYALALAVGHVAVVISGGALAVGGALLLPLSVRSLLAPYLDAG